MHGAALLDPGGAARRGGSATSSTGRRIFAQATSAPLARASGISQRRADASHRRQRQGAAPARRRADGWCGRRPTASRRRCSACSAAGSISSGRAARPVRRQRRARHRGAEPRGRGGDVRRAGAGGAAGAERQPRALRVRRPQPQVVGQSVAGRRWRGWPARGGASTASLMDPPYGQGLADRTRWRCSRGGAAAPGRLGGGRAPRRRSSWPTPTGTSG